MAVVGASVSESAAASKVLANLRHLGYGGRIYPVNPRYEQVAGLPCYPSLTAIPNDIEAAFVGLPAEKAVGVVEEAGRRGVRSLIVNASGFADAGPDGSALQTRLAQIAVRYGLAVCGPNNMGVINWLDGAALWTGTLVTPERTGPVGVISQSGSISIIFAADDRGIGLGMIISSGNEAVLTS
ncbi:MAG: CoA-binding protein, partial [Armatimonadota bacterium]